MNIPNNPQMERVALGAMILYPEDRARGCDLLTPQDFYLDAHRLVHRAIVCMSYSNKDVNIQTLTQWMRDEGTLQQLPQEEVSLVLLTEDTTRGSIKTYASDLRELYRRRMLLTAASGIVNDAQLGTSADCLANRMEEALLEVRAESTTSLLSAKDAFEMVVESLQPETAVSLIPSGIHGLDAKLGGGFRPGRLYFIGALPARGKTAEGRQIVAHAAARYNTPSLVFSIEATIEEWAGVDLANEADLPAWKILEPRYLSSDDRRRAEEIAQRLQAWPVWFDDSSEQNIARVITKARIAVMQHGVKLIVLDYIQRVDGGGKELRNRIGNVGKRLAEFAKKHKVAVIVLSQVHRLGDVNQRPTMQNLKESGDLEAHAHAIILNYRPVDLQTEEFTGDDELIVAKNRFGRTGTVPVRFDNERLRFFDRSLNY